MTSRDSSNHILRNFYFHPFIHRKQCYILRRARQTHSFIIKVTYIEIYKEELRDLLNIEASAKDLCIREDDQGSTVVCGARQVKCLDEQDVVTCLEAGSAMRHTGATLMNEQSSRSHSIFTITIEQRCEKGCGGVRDGSEQT
ncbi:PREDICTED: kinesin-like protein KIF27 [Priapulus caudatus]|uniref:Kinesin-like protein KIF27 n=1 Tax=Priapulus caudatus TaxID=37621 RepID=A0ABM1E0J0_PRICU|nr:PREDICTED: kinesin-like protein KIF27 [Priapulus caudatus]